MALVGGGTGARLSGGAWRRQWQAAFPEENREVPIGLVLEVHHSRISRDEVVAREEDYRAADKQVIWVLDGTEGGVTTRVRHWPDGSSSFLLNVQSIDSLTRSFETRVFIHVNDQEVFAILPGEVRCGMVSADPPQTVEQIIEVIRQGKFSPLSPSKRHCCLTICQDPPGSGKTYRLVLQCLRSDEFPAFAHYRIVFFLTKPHSAKEVLRREFDEQLDRYKDLVSLESKSREEDERKRRFYWRRVKHKDSKEPTLFIMLTGDSFLWNLGTAPQSAPDVFRGVCETIAKHGPRVTRYGHVEVKGQSVQLRADTLLCWDEATKFDEHYLQALLRIMDWCHADAIVAGDVLQSIETSRNVMSRLVSRQLDKPQLPDGMKLQTQQGNEIRRFGPRLVEFLCTLVPYEDFGLPRPVAASDIIRESDGEYFVHVMPNMKDEDGKEVVDQIMKAVQEDVQDLCLLPNDLLVVFPFVTKNPIGDELRARLHDFWTSALRDQGYRQRVLDYDRERERYDKPDRAKKFLTEYDCARAEDKPVWLGHFHRSEEGRPVDTSLSENATRMVSIHASQGDGRRVAYAVNLSESALRRFAGSDNLIYNSLLNVMLSRAKTRLRVFVQPHYDAVWRKLQPLIPEAQRIQVKPYASVSPCINLNKATSASLHNDLDLQEALTLHIKQALKKQWGDDWLTSQSTCIVEHEHHVLRAAAFQNQFNLRIQRDQPQRNQISTILAKISKLEIRALKSQEYFDLLRKFKRDKDLPEMAFLEHGERQDPFGTRCRTICKYLEQVQSKCGCNLNPLEAVAQFYMVDIHCNRQYANTKADALYDIFGGMNHNHYQYLHTIEAIFDKVLGSLKEERRWNIHHRIILGDNDGCKLQQFDFQINIHYCAVTDQDAVAFLLRPSITTVSLADLALQALLTTIAMLLPGGDSNMKRFSAKNIRVCVVALEQQRILDLDLSTLLMERWDNIVDWLGRYTAEIFQDRHQGVLELFEHLGNNVNKTQDHLGSNVAKHIVEAFGDLQDDVDASSEQPSREMLKRKLDKSLEKAINRTKKRLRPA